jgi:hypothetical protein
MITFRPRKLVCSLIMKNMKAMVTTIINLDNRPKPIQPSSKLSTTSFREMRKKSKKSLF